MSGGLLNGRVTTINARLLPGFCPWRPSLNAQNYYLISSFFTSKANSELTCQPIFISAETIDITDQEENEIESVNLFINLKLMFKGF